MAKTNNGSIDDITPQQWNEMNRMHLDEIKRKQTMESQRASGEEIFTVTDSDYNNLDYDMEEIEYKFREGELIEEFQNYIDSTYGAHYGQGGLQSSEVIIDRGHGMGFFSGNVDKYNGRYGKKGTAEDHRKDIMKIIQYGFLMLFEHDRIHGNTTD